MFVEIVKINNDSNVHHFVLLKQQSKQKLSNAFMARENMLFLSYLGSSALEFLWQTKEKSLKTTCQQKISQARYNWITGYVELEL